MTYVPDWPLIGQIITGFIDFFASLTPIAVAAIVAWIAYQQWRTARDKLALDLFDRRFESYRAIINEVRLYRAEAYRERSTILRGPSSHSTELGRLAREARFLFGKEVLEQVWKLIESLDHLEKRKDTLQELKEDDERGAIVAGEVLLAFKAAAIEEDRFNRLVEPYMMVSKIAVAVPSDYVSHEDDEDEFMDTVRKIIERERAALEAEPEQERE